MVNVNVLLTDPPPAAGVVAVTKTSIAPVVVGVPDITPAVEMVNPVKAVKLLELNWAPGSLEVTVNQFALLTPF